MTLTRSDFAATADHHIDAELPLVAAKFDADLLHEEPGVAPGDTVHLLYHLARFEAASGVSPAEFDTVVEWGGGCGNLARLMWRIRGGRVTYVLVATRDQSARQWRYLSEALGSDRVKLVDRPGSGIGRDRVNLVAEDLISGVRLSCDLFVSARALDRAPQDAQDLVVERRWFGARHLLLAMDEGAPLGERALADGAAAVPVGEHAPGRRYIVR